MRRPDPPGRVANRAATFLAVAARLRRPDRLRSAMAKLGEAWRNGGALGAWSRIVQKLHWGSPRYSDWVKAFDTLRAADRRAIARRLEALSPLDISLLMLVSPESAPWLRATVASLKRQLHSRWELWVVAESSVPAELRATLDEATSDPRIRFVATKPGAMRSEALNAALALARGDFVAVVDAGDRLASHALYTVVEELGRCPNTDVLYSDEDGLDRQGRRVDPIFKPDWSPDLLTSYEYVGRLAAYRTAVVRRVGGFRGERRECMDYDLCLRCVAGTSGDRIRHVPQVLYHRRRQAVVAGTALHAVSVAAAASQEPASVDAGSVGCAGVVKDFIARRERGAVVLPGRLPDTYRIVRSLPSPPPLVSLIIPTRDRAALLRTCIDSIRAKTSYPRYEIVVVDNQSQEAETRRYFEELRETGTATIVPYDQPFNYSAINNCAAALVRGELIGLLNNDVEVTDGGWLSEMATQALRPEVGAVGAKLMYPDGSIQHAGVVTGLGGVADHGHRFLPAGDPGYCGRAQVVQNVSAVTGACLVVRRELYLRAGGLDAEHLAVAFNDVDFCLRLREMGYLNVWTPFAELIHHESVSRGAEDTPEKLAREAREIEFMQGRWGRVLAEDPYYSPNLTVDAEDFALAWPPRVVRPWRSVAPGQAVHVGQLRRG